MVGSSSNQQSLSLVDKGHVSCGTPEAFGLVSHLGKEFRPVGISTRCLYLSPFTESAPIDWSKLRRPRKCRRMNADMRGVKRHKDSRHLATVSSV